MRRTACLLFAVVGAALFFLDASSARADVYDDNPGAAARAASDLNVFARAPDGSILWRNWDGDAWVPWDSLGGTATSGPTAAAYNESINVFVAGADGGVYQNYLAAGKWSGWLALGGTTLSAVAANQRRGPLNYFDIAVKGTDNAIYFKTFVPTTGWTGWATLGGSWTSAPALNSQADGIVNVFVRGPDCALWQKAWNGAAWSEWVSLGGCIVGAPTVVTRSPGLVDVFVRALDNSLAARHWDGATWGPWTQVDPAPIASAPVAMSDQPGRMMVFARGERNTLKSKTWDGNGWSAWRDFGSTDRPAPPAPPPGPPATAPLPDGRVNLKTGVACTPEGGRLRVSVAVKKPKGKRKPRVTRIVFFTKGSNRRVRTDRSAPFEVHLAINRPAGSTGRVYARVYYKRSARGKTYRKVVSRRYKVCR